MSDKLLTLSGVHTYIGAYHILHGVDLEVPRGQLPMLLGRNGAGKTTLVRHLNGLLQPTSGSVLIGDWDTKKNIGGKTCFTGWVRVSKS